MDELQATLTAFGHGMAFVGQLGTYVAMVDDLPDLSDEESTDPKAPADRDA